MDDFEKSENPVDQRLRIRQAWHEIGMAIPYGNYGLAKYWARGIVKLIEGLEELVNAENV